MSMTWLLPVITIPRGQYATREFICRAGFICHVISWLFINAAAYYSAHECPLIKAPELIIAPMNASSNLSPSHQMNCAVILSCGKVEQHSPIKDFTSL
jgi:hypothetical protein